MAGVSMMPETFTVAPASVVCGLVVTMTGRYRWAVWSGWVLTVVGMGVLTMLEVDTSTVEWVFLNLIAGTGTGLLFPAMAFAIQAASTDANMALSVAMFSFFRALGQSIGVAVGGVVFQNGMRKQMLKFAEIAPMADEYSKDAAALVEVIKHMPKDLPARAQIIFSYARGLQDVWAVMAAFAGLALLASLYTRGLSLNRELVTDQGFMHDGAPPDEETAVQEKRRPEQDRRRSFRPRPTSTTVVIRPLEYEPDPADWAPELRMWGIATQNNRRSKAFGGRACHDE